MVESELIGLPGKALTQNTTRILRLGVHAAGRLHSMVLHGHRAGVPKASHTVFSQIFAMLEPCVLASAFLLDHFSDLERVIYCMNINLSHPFTYQALAYV